MGLVALFTVLAGSAIAAKYVYDANGRLVVVTNDSGQSARYVYDKLGNLLRVERLAADDLAIFDFSPVRGGVGLPITIAGQGFSTTPANNVVNFNGTPATVVSAAPTELVAQVPAGATTGPLTVTVGSQTATGPVNFVVDENAQPPVIADVSPLVVASGTPVTVIGDRLHPSPEQTRVSLNGRLASPTSINNTQIIFPVPARTGSGKVSVGTPYGNAVSTQDVIVAPTGIVPADIVAAGRLLMDGPAQAASASTSNQSVALLFDGVAGVLTSLQFSNLGANSVSYTLYGPNNVSVVSGSVSATRPTVHLPRLMTATYLLLMKPSSAPATWSVALEKDQAIAVDGDIATVSNMIGKRYTFTATAGQNLGLGLSEVLTPAGPWAGITAYVYRPNGSQLTYETCYQYYGGCDLNLPNLAAGTYSVVLSSNSGTMSFKAALSADVATTLALSVPYELAVPRPGQNGRLTFSAAAGQTVALNVANVATVPVGRSVYYTVYKPDGSILQSTGTASGLTFNLHKLPVSGNYTLVVDPGFGETLTAQVTLLPGVIGTETPTGTPGNYSTQAAGQNVYLSFTAAAGQNLGLGLSELTSSAGAWGGVTTSVLRPDGSQLIYETCYPYYSGCDLNLPNLTAGTYTVVISPNSASTMSFKAALSADLTAALVSGTAYDLALARAGQNGRFTFSGTAGETLALNVANAVTVPASRSVSYSVYKPDGSLLQSTGAATSLTLNLANLPVSGIYTLTVDPNFGETLTAQVTLLPGVVGTETPTGTPGSYATTAAGQSVYLSFTAAAGQNMGLGLSELTSSAGAWGGVTVSVNRPDGSQLAAETCYPYYGGCDVNLPNLTAGIYTVVIAPNGASTMSFKAALSDDVTTTLASSVAYDLALARPGQNGRLQFNGTLGQTVALSVANAVTVPANRSVSYTVYKPDGSLLQSRGSASGLAFNLSNLPVSGIYTLVVDPDFGETLTGQVMLLPGIVDTVTPTGTPGSYATTAAGQSVYLSFTAAAGQNMGLGLSELTSSAGAWGGVTVSVNRPDGSQLTAETCYPYYSGCDLNLPNLTAGTYTVVIAPNSGTMSFKAAVSTDITPTLASGVAYALALARSGQNGRLRFNGTAGQTVALNVASPVTVPASRNVAYQVYKPDGSLLQSADTASALTFNLAKLPVTGIYTLMVDPNFGETLTAQVTLLPGVTGTTTTTGTPGSYATTAAGQNVYLSFIATAGQNLGLGLSELTTSAGVWTGVTVSINRPDGTQLTYETCYQNYGGCDLNLPNMTAGTYSVAISPNSGTMSFKAALSADVAATLASGVVYDLALARPGQNGRLKFSGTSGQTVVLKIANQATTPTDRTVYYTVIKPDGDVLQSGNTAASTLTLNLARLPASGNYTLVVDPNYGETLTAQVTFFPGVSGPLTPTGTPGSYATQVAGQSAYFTFTATAGQNLGFGLSDLVSSAGIWTGVTVYVNRPDGSQLMYETCYQNYGGCDLNLTNLSAGTYSILIAPNAGTMSFKATLSADVAPTLATSVAYALVLDRPGQNGRLKFSATAGQTLALNVASPVTTPTDRDVYYTVYKPDGSVLQSSNTRAEVTLNLPKLPVTGNYTLFVDPNYGETLTAQVTLLPGITGTETPTGTAGSYLTQASSQSVYLSFTATTGQNLGLGLSELTSSAGVSTPITAYVYRPDGSQLTYMTCYQNYGGCDLDLPNLIAGAYSVVISPSSGTMSFKATLSADVMASLASGVAYDLALTRSGQNARLQFNGTAGQTVVVNVTGQATVPADRNVYYTVYKPDGSVLQSSSTRTQLALNLPSLPANGTYTLFVDSNYGETLTAQITQSGASGNPTPPGNPDPVITVGGTPGTYATQTAGQSVSFTFNATAGQNLGLGLSELVTSGGSTAYVYIYRPDGSQLTYEYCYQSYGSCDLNLSNLMAGMYRVVVTPNSGTISFKAAVSADVAPTLASGVAYALDLARPGQNGRLKFNGTAGQTVALKIANQVTAPISRNVYYTVFKPDGSVLQSGNNTGTALTLNLTNLPVSGTYDLFVDPNFGETLTAQITYLPGVAGTLTSTGTPATYATTAAGQSAYLSFTATAGQNLGLGLSELVTSDGSGIPVYVYVYRPDGSQLAYEYCYAQYGGCDLNLPAMFAGTYRVVISPSSGTMSFKAALSADVTVTLASGTPYNLTLARAGQNGRLKFSGTANQAVALKIVNQTTVPANRNVYYTVYKPDGSVLQSGYTASSVLTLNLAKLPVSGTYTLMVDPNYGETSTTQVTLLPGVTGTLTPTGAPSSFATTAAAQSVYLTFVATAGQNLGLGLSDLVASDGVWTSVYVYVYRPDGSQLTYENCYPNYGTCDLNLPNMMAGTHRVVIAPNSGTVTFNAALSTDVAATLASGVAYELALARAGQNGRLTFSGTAGQTVALKIANQTTLPASRQVYYTVYKPDGSLLQSGSTTGSSLTMNLANLPVSGNYALVVDPYYGETLTAQVTLVPGVIDTLTPTGAPGTYATTTAGQSVYLTFAATAGQNLGLGLSDLTFDGVWTPVYVYVYRPDGSQLAYENCYQYYGSCDLNLPNLLAGTYRVVISPNSGTMNFQVALSTDVTATLSSEVAYDLALVRPGQNSRLTFSGTAGQTVALKIANQATVPVSRQVYYTVYKPDGSLLQSGSTTGSSLTMNLANLPVSGNYALVVDPYYGETLTAQVTLVPGVIDTLTPTGPPGSYATTTAGQSVYLTFAATAGQNLGLGLSDLVTSDGVWTQVNVSVYRPDGSQLAYENCYQYYGSCDLNLPNLLAGTYRVVISPNSGTLNFQVALSADVTATLSSGVGYDLALLRPGQNGRLTFDGIAAQTVALRINNQTTVPASRTVYYSVYKPDGSLLQSGSTGVSGLTLNLANLPVSGSYALVVDSYYGETLTAQVTFLPGVTGTLTPTGTPGSYATAAAGQNVYFTFAAASGQDLGLGLSDLVTPGTTNYASVYVYRPDGSQLTYATCYSQYNGCEVNLPNLMSGTYSVLVQAPSESAMSFQATLSADLTATLQPDQTYDLNLVARGQNGRLRFDALAGQIVMLNVAGLTTVPASQPVNYTVYKPDGSVLQTSSMPANGAMALGNMPAEGAYSVFIDPAYGATATGQVTLR